MSKADKEVLKALRLVKALRFVETMRRLPLRDLLNAMADAGPSAPDQPRLDMSDWSDRQLLDMLNVVALGDAVYDNCVDSAVEELKQRADAECITFADYIYDIVECERS